MPIRPFIPYALIGLIHLTAILLAIDDWITWTKPLLMPALAFVVWQRSLRPPSIFGRWLLIALFFSWVGDILLLPLPVEGSFLIGLGFFFCAQVTYIRLFWQASAKKQSSNPLVIFWALPFLFYGAGILLYLWPKLQSSLRIPVLMYSVALVGMGVFAARLGFYFRERYTLQLLIGASLFIISDTLIALTRFAGWAIPGSPFWIMSTYWLAQGLIVYGLIGWLERRRTLRSDRSPVARPPDRQAEAEGQY